jgi:hypothetical protein
VTESAREFPDFDTSGDREDLGKFFDSFVDPNLPPNRQVHPIRAVRPKRFG